MNTLIIKKTLNKITVWVIGLGTLVSCGGAGDSYNPTINPADFTTEVTNRYLTLSVGDVMIYEKKTKSGIEKIQIEIMSETKVLEGVTTRVFWDRVYLDGKLIEDTKDYIAQHKGTGDVWYFGEDVSNYENGKLKDHEGAWLAGVDGARPGIWIKAKHTVGDSYRQEYSPNVAEDMTDVVEVGVTVKTATKSYTDCVKMFDWTPLRPESKEHKYYCPEAGTFVLAEDVVSGERSELKSVTRK